MNERVGVARAGFQERHAHFGILGQTIRQNAAGSAGANDDVVKLGHGNLPQGRRDAPGLIKSIWHRFKAGRNRNYRLAFAIDVSGQRIFSVGPH